VAAEITKNGHIAIFFREKYGEIFEKYGEIFMKTRQFIPVMIIPIDFVCSIR
jgi:hypothetical protein